MLTGPELGAALKSAMKKKGVTQKTVGAHFGITQPSVSEWIKHGRIGKQHIPKLVEYFADVVAPTHWGLPAAWSAPEPSDDFLPLRDGEHDLLAAWRLLNSSAQHDVLAKAIQLMLDQNPGIAALMGNAGVSRRADDVAVLEWWSRVQTAAPRQPIAPPQREQLLNRAAPTPETGAA